MKNILTVLLIAGILLMIPFTASAVDMSKMPGESVYASVAEQNEVYDIIQKSEIFINSMKEHGVSVVKESITPICVANLLDYAETGIFEMIPLVTGHFKEIPTNDGGQVYLIKAITEKGFAGYYEFFVEEGIAQPTNFKPSSQLEPDNISVVSFSYADHAERIAKLTNSETFLPASEVRYVRVDNLGNVFYVNDGKTEMLIAISADANAFRDKGEIIYVGEDLKTFAEEKLKSYKEQLAEIEEWKAAHPGEDYTFAGGYGLYSPIKIDGVNDITNISEHLASNSKETSSAGISAIVLVIISFVAVLIATTIIIIRKRNQQS